jgi:hypothetical protein
MLGSWNVTLRFALMIGVLLLIAFTAPDSFGSVAPNGADCCP